VALCSPWIDGTDVAECCNVEDCDTPSVLQGAAEAASELLFMYSMRQFPGICERTVRPCRTNCFCPWQVLSRGHIVWNWNYAWAGYGYGAWTCNSDCCGCRPLSRVLLGGYVQEVTEVVINGVIIDPDTYRVDSRKWLTRVRPSAGDDPARWPGCQNLDLPETEEGTWAVTYTYGKDVPASGINAAIALACEIYKQCTNQKCALPANTTRVLRQGIAVEKPAFISWGFEKGGRSIPRGWKTGIPAVDVFLNAVNPTGLVRVPVVWSPSTPLRYAPSLGLSTPGS